MSDQPSTLARRLRGARRRRFVGRDGELELFRAGLEVPAGPDWAVLWIHGPGGVGKTALLGVLEEDAETAGVPAWRLDLRAVELSPAGFWSALAPLLGADDPEAALAAPGRRVLLLDTYETAAGFDAWIREQFVPGLGEDTLVVIAGREPPGRGWREDPGWRELLRTLSLRNLPPGDARALLAAAGIGDDLHDRVLELTHGHPLALSLLVDVLAQREGAPPELAAAPDVVGELLARFVADVPSRRHRAALEACAHTRVTTEGLLRVALGGDDAGELFAWLRALSFVEEGAEGLFPHDLARDVLDADLRWRDRGHYAEVHGNVRRHVVGRILASDGRAQRAATTDLMFLHRGNAGIRPFYDWDTLGRAYADAIRPTDEDAVLAMVERHETAASLAIARYWLARRRDAFAVVRRTVDDAPIGFGISLPLHEATAEDRAEDPGAAAMWDYVVEHGAPRPGEEVWGARMFMDAERYQAPSPSLNAIAIDSTQRWVARRRPGWDLLGAWADPDAIGPFFSHIDFPRAPEADYTVGGRRYGVFAHDWRRRGVEAWFDLMESRELADEAGGGTTAPPPAVALSHDEFTAAVRRALRDLHRPEALAACPLGRTRVAQEQELRALIEEAVATLAGDPRDAKLARALERTYVKPAPTQEAAAELLGLPFSTYRGHLTRGIERVADRLWQRELYGP